MAGSCRRKCHVVVLIIISLGCDFFISPLGKSQVILGDFKVQKMRERERESNQHESIPSFDTCLSMRITI